MQAYIASAVSNIFWLNKGLTGISYYLVSYIVTFTNHVSLYGDFSIPLAGYIRGSVDSLHKVGADAHCIQYVRS